MPYHHHHHRTEALSLLDKAFDWGQTSEVLQAATVHALLEIAAAIREGTNVDAAIREGWPDGALQRYEESAS